jgi:hypothetical protein
MLLWPFHSQSSISRNKFIDYLCGLPLWIIKLIYRDDWSRSKPSWRIRYDHELPWLDGHLGHYSIEGQIYNTLSSIAAMFKV